MGQVPAALANTEYGMSSQLLFRTHVRALEVYEFRKLWSAVKSTSSQVYLAIFLCSITNHTAQQREKKKWNRTDKANSSYSRPKVHSFVSRSADSLIIRTSSNSQTMADRYHHVLCLRARLLTDVVA